VLHCSCKHIAAVCGDVCIGLCVVTVLLAASVLLVTLSFVWRRLAARSPVLTLHHLSSTSAASDEEQGLLTDVISSAAVADGETAETGRRSQANRPNRLVSTNNYRPTGFTNYSWHFINTAFWTQAYWLNSALSINIRRKPNPESDEMLFYLLLKLLSSVSSCLSCSSCFVPLKPRRESERALWALPKRSKVEL